MTKRILDFAYFKARGDLESIVYGRLLELKYGDKIIPYPVVYEKLAKIPLCLNKEQSKETLRSMRDQKLIFLTKRGVEMIV